MKHAELIARLEAAEVGARVLDATVEIVVRATEAHRAGITKEHAAKWTTWRDGWVEDGHTSYKSEPVTTSLDAALALAERVLPDVLWRVEKFDSRMFDAQVWDDPLDSHIGFGRASSPSIALCIAILKALDNQ